MPRRLFHALFHTPIHAGLITWAILVSCLAGCTGGTPSAPPTGGLDVSEGKGDGAASADPSSPESGSSESLLSDDWFEDVAAQAGIRFSYRNGVEGEHLTILETMGGGAAIFDFDGDGAVDLFLCGGGTISRGTPITMAGLPPALFRNEGDWRFAPVTAAAGLDGPAPYSHACVVGDYDEDGFPDLFITGYGGTRLYHNNGAGGFHDATAAAGLPQEGWTIAACWADVDGDGLVDLLVGGYATWTPSAGDTCGDPQRGIPDVCAPHNYPGAPSRLYQNAGDGRFIDVSREAGLRDDDRALGIIATDMNNDGRIDFYVANDGIANLLYLGGPQFPIREVGEVSGAALSEFGAAEGSMGVNWGDFNGDGLGDLFVTNFEAEDNALYRQQAEALFQHVSAPAGLAGACKPYVGFGTGFVDFDLDGWQDLFVCNGHVYYRTGGSPYRQPAFLFRNRGGIRFDDLSSKSGPYFRQTHVGRGAAAGDLDGDGAIDLVIVHQNDPVAVLKNRRRPAGWISLKLVGRSASRDATGAVVTGEFQGRRLVRWVRSGAGYLSSFDQRIVLPVDPGQPGQVQVRWLGGRTETFDSLPAGRTSILVEGAGRE